MQNVARALILLLVVPMALLTGAIWTGHLALWVALAVVEYGLFKAQRKALLGAGALFYNRRGVHGLQSGDAVSAVRAFERAAWFGNGAPAYVNNMGLALVYTGDLERARAVLEPVVVRTELDAQTRGVLMSTWAMLLALLGDLDGARRADEEAFRVEYSVAAWIIAARERRWPFTRPAEIRGAWTRSLFDVLEAFVTGHAYRDRELAATLPTGLARALAYAWPEMRAFLGG